MNRFRRLLSNRSDRSRSSCRCWRCVQPTLASDVSDAVDGACNGDQLRNGPNTGVVLQTGIYRLRITCHICSARYHYRPSGPPMSSLARYVRGSRSDIETSLTCILHLTPLIWNKSRHPDTRKKIFRQAYFVITESRGCEKIQKSCIATTSKSTASSPVVPTASLWGGLMPPEVRLKFRNSRYFASYCIQKAQSATNSGFMRTFSGKILQPQFIFMRQYSFQQWS